MEAPIEHYEMYLDDEDAAELKAAMQAIEERSAASIIRINEEKELEIQNLIKEEDNTVLLRRLSRRLRMTSSSWSYQRGLMWSWSTSQSLDAH